MTFPTPKITPETAEYWAAANQKRLLVKRCNACGETHHYPRPLCPFCMSEDTEWLECSGEGAVYSFTIVRRGPGTGTVPALVTLKEGPTILSGIVDTDPEHVAIGASVTVTFVESENGQLLPMFSVKK